MPEHGFPSAEGPDDDAEPARHGEPRLHALARRPHRRQRRAGVDAFDEDAAFKKFNPAFPGLIGRETQLTRRRHAGVHRLHPHRHLSAEPDPPPRTARSPPSSRTGTTSSSAASPTSSSTATAATRSNPAAGFFGSDGFATFEGETQMFKVPHLRNVYQKVGMFGRPQDDAAGPAGARLRRPARRQRRHGLPLPRLRASSALTNASSDASSSSCSPSTRTWHRSSGSRSRSPAPTRRTSANRIDLLIARDDDGGECEVVVKGTIAGEARGGYLTPAGPSSSTAPASRRSPTPTCARWRPRRARS